MGPLEALARGGAEPAATRLAVRAAVAGVVGLAVGRGRHRGWTVEPIVVPVEGGAGPVGGTAARARLALLSGGAPPAAVVR